MLTGPVSVVLPVMVTPLVAVKAPLTVMLPWMLAPAAVVTELKAAAAVSPRISVVLVAMVRLPRFGRPMKPE